MGGTELRYLIQVPHRLIILAYLPAGNSNKHGVLGQGAKLQAYVIFKWMQSPHRGGSSDREKEELQRRVASPERQGERALAENARLRKQVEEALRANKRSAAPFSKGNPQSDPQPPGRKPGAAYRQRATRPVPSRVEEQNPRAAPRKLPPLPRSGRPAEHAAPVPRRHRADETRTADVVDAVVVTVALRQKATILTSDPDDIERLVRASGREVAGVTV